jgi:hypothetical protein
MTVVPLPGSLSTEIEPSCASTMALLIVSPRPVPWMARSVTLGAR